MEEHQDLQLAVQTQVVDRNQEVEHLAARLEVLVPGQALQEEVQLG